jgi:hypothetical protein
MNKEAATQEATMIPNVMTAPVLQEIVQLRGRNTS